MSRYEAVGASLLAECPELNLSYGAPLAPLTSFRIGGPCALLVTPHSRGELQKALSVLDALGENCLLLGSGTNVLVPDEGIDGIVVRTREGLEALRRAGETTVIAESGVPLSRLASFACECGLTGLEFAHGIPGTVGGGIFMNAGAYGGELAQAAVRTVWLSRDGAVHTAEGDEQEFGYRTSVFQYNGGIIAEAEFSLQPGDPEQIRAKMRELMEKRREKQPLELPSAGSAFRRPAGYFAGALIEQAGLKGFRIGGAAVSEKHAGFVVNLGSATAADVRAVLEAVQSRVLAQSGVLLEPEIRIL